MTTVQVEASPFAMFPAQGDYSNHDWEKSAALRVLEEQADSTDELREVALMLELIDPPKPEETAPVLCDNSHDQAQHGARRRNGERYCRTCSASRVRNVDTKNAAGTRRRLQHLLLNGFTQRGLARLLDSSTGTVSRVALEQNSMVARKFADGVRALFDERRDEYHDAPGHKTYAETRKNWVWAELYEDLDDPECEPVVPGRAAA